MVTDGALIVAHGVEVAQWRSVPLGARRTALLASLGTTVSLCKVNAGLACAGCALTTYATANRPGAWGLGVCRSSSSAGDT